MTSFWENLPETGEDIRKIENSLQAMALEEQGCLQELLQDILGRKGKYLRGGFCVLAGRFTGRNREQVLQGATALEAFHLATLIHDDIIDGAQTRRGKISLHRRYGIRQAVLAGDFLYSRAMMEILPLLKGEDESNLVKAIIQICRQEIQQSLSRELNWSLREYLRRAAGKTAALFSLSLYTGASISEADSSTSEDLRRLGYFMGLSFQMVDDLLDYENRTGKPRYQDLKNGLVTLPLLLSVRDSQKQRQRAQRALKLRNLPGLVRMIHKGGGLDQAREMAENYYDRSRQILQNLPEHPAKEDLNRLMGICLKRSF